MKLEYEKETIRRELLLGALFLLLGTVGLYVKTIWLQSYGQIMLGVCGIVLAWYHKEKGYLSLEGNYLKKHDLPLWKVNLDDVIAIKETRNGYELRTEHKRYTINTAYMQYDSLKRLRSELKRIKEKG